MKSNTQAQSSKLLQLQNKHELKNEILNQEILDKIELKYNNTIKFIDTLKCISFSK